MQRIKTNLAALTGAEKVIAATVAVALASTIIFATIAVLKRPADVSNPDAAFEEAAAETLEEANTPSRRRVDWPRFGFDTERTKFLNAQRIKPPFRRVWRYDQDELIEFAPIIRGNRMFMIDNDGVFVALNVDTGRVVWKKQHGVLNASSPAFVNGSLIAVNLEPPQAIAVNANSGKLIWSRDLPSRAESSPMVIRDRAYFGTENGSFYALDRRNGKVIWETRLAGSVKAAPAFSDGTLYVGDYAGKFYALRAADGAIQWQQSDLGAGLGRTGRFYSTPAVAFGRVYVGNVDGRVYSFEQDTGEIAWTHSAGDFVYSGVAAAQTAGTEPAIYVGSHDKNVYSLDARSGDVIWASSPGGQVSGPATVIGDVAYFSTFSGNATAGFDLKTGRRVFKFDDGEYGPVVSDGERLYVVGGSSVTALKPVKIGNRSYRPNDGFKGIVPPSQLRKIRNKLGKREPGAGKNAKAEKGSSGKKGAKGTGSGKKAAGRKAKKGSD